MLFCARIGQVVIFKEVVVGSAILLNAGAETDHPLEKFFKSGVVRGVGGEVIRQVAQEGGVLHPEGQKVRFGHAFPIVHQLGFKRIGS